MTYIKQRFSFFFVYLGLILALLTIVSVACTPAHSFHHDYEVGEGYVIVNFDAGGEVQPYFDRIDKWNLDNVEVRIKGSCWSACTLYLAAAKVCTYNTASFHFHAPYRVGPRGSKTYDMKYVKKFYDYYPSHVRAWIDYNGGLGRDWLHFVGKHIHSSAPACK